MPLRHFQGGSLMTRWLQDWFDQQSVLDGDPTRRSIEAVHRACTDTGDELKQEAMNLGWHVVRTDTHYILIPSGTMTVIC